MVSDSDSSFSSTMVSDSDSSSSSTSGAGGKKGRWNPTTKSRGTQYLQGSMVWAKRPGCLWWPAMIRGESKGASFLRKSGKEFHVQFFENPPCRAWIPRRCKDEYAPQVKSSDKLLEMWAIACDFADAEPLRCMSLEERLEKYWIICDDESTEGWSESVDTNEEVVDMEQQETTSTRKSNNNECVEKEVIIINETSIYKNPAMTPTSEAECAAIAGYEFIQENIMPPHVRRLQEKQIRFQHYLLNRESLACVCRETGGRKCTLRSRCPNVIKSIACPASCGSSCRNNPWAHNQFLIGKKTFLRTTNSKGFGLFASSFIGKQQFLGEYTGNIIPYREDAPKDEAWYYISPQPQPTDFVINAHRQGSALRLINNSCEPNCEAIPYVHNGLYKVVFITIKDIVPGEEIVMKYCWEGVSKHDAIRCLCKAPNCSGFIGTIESTSSESEMEESPKIRRWYALKPIKNAVQPRLLPSPSSSSVIPASSSKRSFQEEAEASKPGNMPPLKKSSPGDTRSEVAIESISKIGDPVIVVDVSPPASKPINSSARESVPSPPSFSVNNVISKGQDLSAVASSSQSVIHQGKPSENSGSARTEAGGQPEPCFGMTKDEPKQLHPVFETKMKEDADLEEQQNIAQIPELNDTLQSYLQEHNSFFQQTFEQLNNNFQQQLQKQNANFQNQLQQSNLTNEQRIVALQNHFQIQNFVLEQHIQTQNASLQRHHLAQNFIIQQQIPLQHQKRNGTKDNLPEPQVIGTLNVFLGNSNSN